MSKIANDIWAGTLAGSKSHHANIHWAAERRRLNECSKIARFKYLDSIYLCENCQEAWRWRRTRAREMERERERQWWFSRLTGIELSGRPSPENAQSIAQFNYFFGVAATFFFCFASCIDGNAEEEAKIHYECALLWWENLSGWHAYQNWDATWCFPM